MRNLFSTMYISNTGVPPPLPLCLRVGVRTISVPLPPSVGLALLVLDLAPLLTTAKPLGLYLFRVALRFLGAGFPPSPLPTPVNDSGLQYPYRLQRVFMSTSCVLFLSKRRTFASPLSSFLFLLCAHAAPSVPSDRRRGSRFRPVGTFLIRCSRFR